MSVIVKGMEMPENCCQCEWHEYYGGDYDWCHACRRTGKMPIENAETERAKDCPLVELPSKHGDLIDRKALKDSVLKWLPPDPCGCEEKERPFETDICVSLMMEIEEQPTVVKAEDEG